MVRDQTELTLEAACGERGLPVVSLGALLDYERNAGRLQATVAMHEGGSEEAATLTMMGRIGYAHWDSQWGTWDFANLDRDGDTPGNWEGWKQVFAEVGEAGPTNGELSTGNASL